MGLGQLTNVRIMFINVFEFNQYIKSCSKENLELTIWV